MNIATNYALPVVVRWGECSRAVIVATRARREHGAVE